MNISLVVESSFSENEGDVVFCTLTGMDEKSAEHVLSFQRSMDMADDDGIYLEYDGQSNGGYNKIKSCELTRDNLKVVLNSQLGELQDVEGFNLALHLPGKEMDELIDLFRIIFQGHQDLLIVS